ncbi:MAG TPA: RidA family protein [Candidatus Acidoferrum sp.]|nr:RidA family protein [Candidatus Acidoferrum sp.]
MQRKIFRLSLLSVLFTSLLLLAVNLHGAAQHKRAISLLDPSLNLPFSDGIVAGNTLYIAGQQGTDAKGNLPDGIGPQTQAALDNIAKVVKQAGFQMSDIVSVTVYLSDIHDFPEMNKVYRTVLPDPKPARATVQVAGLVNGAKIEISAIAVKTRD